MVRFDLAQISNFLKGSVLNQFGFDTLEPNITEPNHCRLLVILICDGVGTLVKKSTLICCFMHRYYILAPLSLFPRAEELFVKTSQGLKSFRHDDFHMNMEAWKPILEIGWLYWLGGAMFIWGWIHQSRCHMILVSLNAHKKSFSRIKCDNIMVSISSCQASLRSKSKEDRDAYKIPYGDWFEYVSSAHYFAEFVSIVQVRRFYMYM